MTIFCWTKTKSRTAVRLRGDDGKKWQKALTDDPSSALIHTDDSRQWGWINAQHIEFASATGGMVVNHLYDSLH